MDVEVARMAARQHGVVTRAQLIRLGLDRNAIAHRLRAGRLHRLFRGVYAVGHRPPSPHARAMAAVLACGENAILSHGWAAWLWGFARRPPARVDVTARATRRHAGIRHHRSRSLDAPDTTTHYGVPVTTPARTLIDLADDLDDEALARAVNEARLKAHLRLDHLAEALERAPGRRATKRLRPFVERSGRPTRSRLEDAFLTFTERHEIPRPEINTIVEGHEVDAVWREQRLIVELDSREFHDSDPAFEADRAKDAELVAAGWRVIRITWRRLVERPEEDALRLARMLRRMPPRYPSAASAGPISPAEAMTASAARSSPAG